MARVLPSVPPAFHVLPDRLFYGWYVTFACACLMFVGVGIGYYGLPVFLSPLREEHGWTTAQVSWAPAIYFGISGITGALSGPYIDRHGPGVLIFVGMLLNAASAASIGLVNELWQLYLAYFVFAVAFGMSTSVATNAIITRWFIRRRALATSFAATGVSMGGIILAPTASRLIDSGGLELATPILGVIVLLVSMPVIFLILAPDPAAVGLTPDGDSQDSPGYTDSDRFRAAQARSWTRIEAVHTVAFWAILTAFLLALVSQTGYVIHQVSFLEDRLGSRSAASLTISLTAFGSTVARLVVGLFADRADKRLIAACLFLLQASCITVVAHVDSVAVTWLVTFAFGFTIGNIYMMQSLLVGEIFGMVSFGMIFGLVSLAGQAGSGVGPIAVGYLHDRSGGYTAPFTILAAIDVVAAAVILLDRPASSKDPPGGALRSDYSPALSGSSEGLSSSTTEGR